MNIQNQIVEIEKAIDSFFEKELAFFYEKEYPFFEESDLINSLHIKLRTYNYDALKIYREYPVDLVPLRLTDKYYSNLIKKDKNIKEFYIKNGAYYELKYIEKKDFLKIDVFKELKFQMPENKFERMYEPKYFDLVVLYPEKNKSDELVTPNIVMEFKYEIDKKRKGHDIRPGIHLPKNDLSSIERDLLSIYQFSKTNPEKIGYFIFLTEGECNLKEKIKNLSIYNELQDHVTHISREKFDCMFCKIKFQS